MNVEIGVGSINVSLTAVLVEPTPVTRKIIVIDGSNIPPMTYSRSTIISLNGHSLSAINPNTYIGGRTMSVLA